METNAEKQKHSLTATALQVKGTCWFHTWINVHVNMDECKLSSQTIHLLAALKKTATVVMMFQKNISWQAEFAGYRISLFE